MADPVRVTAFTLPLSGPNATNPAVVRNFLPWLQTYLDQVPPEFRNSTRLNFECSAGTPFAELFYHRDVLDSHTEEAWITRRLLRERAEKEKRRAALAAQIAAIDLQLGGSPLGG